MKTKYINILKIFILVIVCFVSVGYAAFGTEMSVSNIVADVRVKSDIRITDVSVNDGKYYSLDGFNYDVDSILFGELFWELNDYLLMDVVVTNFGNTEMGIFDIELPSGIGYEITGYKLKDKLCDSQGNCNLGASKTINLKIFPTGDAGLYTPLNIDFDFRKMHTVTYEGITNNGYPTSVIDGGNLKFTFSGTIPNPIFVFVNDVKLKFSKYSYTNGQLVFNNVTGNVTLKSTNVLYDVMRISSNGIDSNIDFALASSETNGDGVNTVSGTENDQYPVYYYRGNVIDNNLIFANKCWKMVRTTNTGGIKLIYNGVPSEDGSCNNNGEETQIGTSVFNSHYNSLAYFGYMYGEVYAVNSKLLTEQTDMYLYGNDVSWDGINYTLTGDTMTSSSWSNDRTNLGTKYHYTCFNDTGICESVYYINFFGNADNAYYLILNDGKNIEKAKEEMFTNTTDSEVKKTIDNWYKENMTSYTNVLEDTVWCNDRTLTAGALHSKDTSSTGASIFAAYKRNMSTFKPSVLCTNTRDSFTVDEVNGNGKLTYPVGLLTADEYTLVGSGKKGYSTTSYLYTGQYQWSLSSEHFNYTYASVFNLESSGYLGSAYVDFSRGVRPAISLIVGTLITSGDGSVNNPFIVE